MTHIDLPEAVTGALAALERAGYPAYAVGGCVRDGLRGIAPRDWDVCTAAKPGETRAALEGAFTVLDTGLKHGTVTAVRDHLHIEITTYRIEGGYSDGRRPDAVTFVDNIEDDLARRDFTVGAIAYSPTRGLCDPFGGQRDLAAGILRCVGDPDARLTEDALRIARAMRLASEHGFSIEEGTALAMRRCMGALHHIARERLCTELTRLLCGKYAGRVLRHERDVLAQILPEIEPMFDLDQQNRHHHYDVWEHTVRATEQVPNVPRLRWSMLLHDSGKPACKTVDEQGVGHFKGHPKASRTVADAITARLKFSNELRHDVLLLVEQHDIPLAETPKMLRRRLAQMGEVRVRDLLAIKKGDVIGQGTDVGDIAWLAGMERMLGAVLRENQCFSLKQLAVNGRDLVGLGLQGGEIGRTLNVLLHHVLDHPQDNDKKTLLALARGTGNEGETT